MESVFAKQKQKNGSVTGRKPAWIRSGPQIVKNETNTVSVGSILKSPDVQTRLRVGKADDKFEREADSVTERVMRMSQGESDEAELQRSSVPEENSHEMEEQGDFAQEDTTYETAVQREVIPEDETDKSALQREALPIEEMDETGIQRASLPEEDTEETSNQRETVPEKGLNESMLQRVSLSDTDTNESEAPGEERTEETDEIDVQRRAFDKKTHTVSDGGVSARITSPVGGRPLPEHVRQFVEVRMGYDFSGVELHDTAQDRTDADRLNARAFTYGKHIWLGKGESAHDKRLMTHELTHVVQQGGVVRKNLHQKSDTPVTNFAQPAIQKRGKRTWGEYFGSKYQAATDYGSNLLKDAGELAKSSLSAAKKWLLKWLQPRMKKIPGYSLLTVILGRNPLTGEKVPRTVANVVREVVSLAPGGKALFENLMQSKSLQRAYARFMQEFDRLQLTWSGIQQLFRRAWDGLDRKDILNPPGVLEKMTAIFLSPVKRLLRFARNVGGIVLRLIFEGVLSLMGSMGQKVMTILLKARTAFSQIIRNPVGFVGNLVKAVVMGFQQFSDNIFKHLKNAIVGWMFGSLGESDLQMPEKFDLRGFVSIVLQILRLTYANIREKLVKRVGEKRVAAIEKAVEFVKIMVTEGLAGVWKKILEYADNLWDTVISAVRNWVVTKIVVAAITKLVSMFNPAGAIIQAILAIYNTIVFFMERWKQITELANSVFDSLTNIAAGRVGFAANYIEKTMVKGLTVMISFLASLLGLDGIAARIRGVIESIRAKIDRAIDRVIDFVLKKAGKFVGSVRGTGGRVAAWWKQRLGFKVGDERHHLFFKGKGQGAQLMVASKEKPVKYYIEEMKNYVKQSDNVTLAITYGNVHDAHSRVERDIENLKNKIKDGEKHAGDVKKQKDMKENLTELKSFLEDFMKIMRQEENKEDERYTGIDYGDLKYNKLGTKAVADPLTIMGEKGSKPYQTNDIWELVRQRKVGDGNFYIQGHLINEQLHGPGTKKNLTPISQTANRKHEIRVESKVKDMVWSRRRKNTNGAERVNPGSDKVHYQVEAIYGNGRKSNKDKLQKELNHSLDYSRDQKSRIRKILDAESLLTDGFRVEAWIQSPDGSKSDSLKDFIENDPPDYLPRLAEMEPRKKINLYEVKSAEEITKNIDYINIELAKQILNYLREQKKQNIPVQYYHELVRGVPDLKQRSGDSEETILEKLRKDVYVTLRQG